MIAALTLALSLTGCVEDVSKDKVQATVSEASEPTARSTKGEVWNVDTERSTLRALAAKVTAKHPIHFGSWRGSLKVAENKVQGLDFWIDMASLSADHPKLTKHLLDADFFDVTKYPAATFVSTAVDASPDDRGNTHLVTGNLTIRGNSKQVRFPAVIRFDGPVVQASTEFAIDRQDFGLSYPGRADDLIQDKVVLTVELVATAG